MSTGDTALGRRLHCRAGPLNSGIRNSNLPAHNICQSDAEPADISHCRKCDEIDHECWICFDGPDAGELISPCLCRGSLRWVHQHCLQRWVTIRLTQRSAEPGRDHPRIRPTQFSCPNCESPYEISGFGEYGGPMVWPEGRLLPNFSLLRSVDADLANSFRWQCFAPCACTVAHCCLLGFTFIKICILLADAATNGWGADIQLVDVIRQGIHQSPWLFHFLEICFGPVLFDDLVVTPGPLGAISKKWSLVFGSIQNIHAKLMMANFVMYVFGCFEWLKPEDLRPLPATVRVQFFRSDVLYFLISVNPPVLRLFRVLIINVLVPFSAGFSPSIQPTLLWICYSVFSSHIDVAWHTLVVTILLYVYTKAARREYCALAEHMEFAWQMHAGVKKINRSASN